MQNNTYYSARSRWTKKQHYNFCLIEEIWSFHSYCKGIITIPIIKPSYTLDIDLISDLIRVGRIAHVLLKALQDIGLAIGKTKYKEVGTHPGMMANEITVSTSFDNNNYYIIIKNLYMNNYLNNFPIHYTNWIISQMRDLTSLLSFQSIIFSLRINYYGIW